VRVAGTKATKGIPSTTGSGNSRHKPHRTLFCLHNRSTTKQQSSNFSLRHLQDQWYAHNCAEFNIHPDDILIGTSDQEKGKLFHNPTYNQYSSFARLAARPVPHFRTSSPASTPSTYTSVCTAVRSKSALHGQSNPSSSSPKSPWVLPMCGWTRDSTRSSGREASSLFPTGSVSNWNVRIYYPLDRLVVIRRNRETK
jgi:hypothetical protein